MHDCRVAGRLKTREDVDVGSMYMSELRHVSPNALLGLAACIFLLDEHQDNLDIISCIV